MAVLTFDFRGFRGSEGRFSLAGEIVDAHNAVSFLLDHPLVRDEQVALYGASFGGAVAICAGALDQRVGTVCVRAPVSDMEAFTSSQSLTTVIEYIRTYAPEDMHGIGDKAVVQSMVEELARDAGRYNPVRLVSRVSPRPVLIVTGDSDELIDLKDVQRLYDAAAEPKELQVVKGADHVLSDPHAREETTQIILRWLNEHHPCVEKGE